MKNYLKVYCVEFQLHHPVDGELYHYYQHIAACNISDAWKCIQATWPQYYTAYIRGELPIYLKQI